jgi:hypothetical protein
MMKRLVLLVLAALAISLLISTVALASTPKDIVSDWADGKLGGHYTKEELHDFLNNGFYKEYPPHDYDGLVQTITDSLDEGRTDFPFTGFQLMIAGIVAVGLIGGGLALRRFARSS